MLNFSRIPDIARLLLGDLVQLFQTQVEFRSLKFWTQRNVLHVEVKVGVMLLNEVEYQVLRVHATYSSTDGITLIDLELLDADQVQHTPLEDRVSGEDDSAKPDDVITPFKEGILFDSMWEVLNAKGVKWATIFDLWRMDPAKYTDAELELVNETIKVMEHVGATLVQTEEIISRQISLASIATSRMPKAMIAKTDWRTDTGMFE